MLQITCVFVSFIFLIFAKIENKFIKGANVKTDPFGEAGDEAVTSLSDNTMAVGGAPGSRRNGGTGDA